MESHLLNVLNHLLKAKGKPVLSSIDPVLRLRQDLGFDSFDLAELTVRLEEISGVDVFAAGVVHTVGEVLSRIGNG